jgi:hypothetical protein
MRREAHVNVEAVRHSGERQPACADYRIHTGPESGAFAKASADSSSETLIASDRREVITDCVL